MAGVTSGLMVEYLGIVMLFVVAAVLCGAFVVGSWFFGPKKNAPYKSAPYECGVTPVGDARERFPIKFYLVAIVFILFDIEVVFLWSWMTVFRGSDRDFMVFTYFEFLTYMATWVIGFMYAIRVGAIDWDDSAILDPSHEFDANPDEQTVTATQPGRLSEVAL